MSVEYEITPNIVKYSMSERGRIHLSEKGEINTM